MARALIGARARGLVAAALAALGSLVALACSARALRPIDASARVGDGPAIERVLRVIEPCVTLPGGTPMGRPDGARSHVLPAGRYPPALQDDGGVYFASPSGIQVTEPAPRGTRTRPGGIYLARGGEAAWEYLGDAGGISTRQVLAGHCRYALEPAPTE